MMAQCPSGKACLMWASKYLKDCVCGVQDEFSLGFGLFSVFSWGIAEVPQIFTNFKSGSTEGVSLGFLMTWVVGDVFNIIGCLLEPATLPTQLYTALLYTMTTVVLVWQTIYYGHISKWWKVRKITHPSKDVYKHSKDSSKEFGVHHMNVADPVNVPDNINNSTELFKKNNVDIKNSVEGTLIPSLPVPIISPRQRSIGKELYYMSARSLASSHTPSSPYLVISKGFGRSGPSYTLNQSFIEEEGLLTNVITPSPKISNSALCALAATTFFVGGLNMHWHAYNTPISSMNIDKGRVIISRRKILQEINAITLNSSSMQYELLTNALGTYLGWFMAVIYMGGRLPQIYLNIKRGTIEGLNPLMFIFALIGNATYVGSIIIRTLEWKKLKPNMPWLVDAAVCVLLDCFILSQFIFYKMRKTINHEDQNGDYEVVK